MTTAMTAPEPLVCAILGPDMELLYAIKDERHELDRETRLREIHEEAQGAFDDREVAVCVVPSSFWENAIH